MADPSFSLSHREQTERLALGFQDNVERIVGELSSLVHGDHTLEALRVATKDNVQRRWTWTLRNGEKPLYTEAIIEDDVGSLTMSWTENGVNLLFGKTNTTVQVLFDAKHHHGGGWTFSARKTVLADQHPTHN